jgi:probable F420-dependent oxidoreductase
MLSAFGMSRTLRDAAAVSRRVEEAGFDRLWLAEGAQPVFAMCAATALSTDRIGLGTSVAVAFARSPMITAQAAWMLARETQGRFILGLGTQVRAHVERRYSAPFAHPGPRMREYIEAVRAIYAAFRGVAPLKFDGDFYSFSLLPPTWSPGPISEPDPPIYVAGVRPWMCRMIGEVADGMLVHPLSTPRYLEDVVIPSIHAGEAAAGRVQGSVALACPVMTAVSDSEEVRRRQRDAIRMRLAFYGSTPGYGVVFDSSGWPGVGERLHGLQREGAFDEMAKTITDEMVDAFAVTSTWDDLPVRLAERFDAVAADVVCYSVLEFWDEDPDAADRWLDVNRRFRSLTGGERAGDARPGPVR